MIKLIGERDEFSQLLRQDILEGNKVTIEYSEELKCWVLWSGCYLYEGETFSGLVQKYVNEFQQDNNMIG